MKRLLAVVALILAGCGNYVYDHDDERPTKGFAAKYHRNAYTSVMYIGGKHPHFVPVFHTEVYELTFKTDSGRFCREGNSPPFEWDRWFDGEPCVAIVQNRYRTEVDDHGKKIGPRAFYCIDLVRVEKPTPEGSR